MVDKCKDLCRCKKFHGCRWFVKYLAYLFMPTLIAIYKFKLYIFENIKLTVLKFVPKGSGLDIL